MAQVSGDYQPTLTPGEQETGLTTQESYDNINPDSPNYEGQDSGSKKSSIFGKLKDKTKKAGTKIKSKVGKKKSDGPGTPGGDHEAEEEEEDSPTGEDTPATKGSNMTPYTGPESVPRAFGTFQSESDVPASDPVSGSADVKGPETPNTTSETPHSTSEAKDFTPDETTGDAPSATQKASEGANVMKDSLYGGAAATAGALGFEGAKDYEDKSIGDKASDTSSDFGGKAEELGNRGYNAAADTKDTMAQKGSEAIDQTKDTFSSESGSTGPDVPGNATEAAYDTKDAAKSKAADLNNSTGDSQTYTGKATSTAMAAKDTIADKLGLNQPSEGPSMMDKAKGYLGSAVDTTKGYTQSATDTAKQQAGQTKGDAGAATDAAKDTTGSAANTAMDHTTSATDTAKNYAGSAYDTTANYAQGAINTTKGYATKATDTTADSVTPKGDDKALSEKVTESLSALPANLKDTAASYTQSTTSPTTHDEAQSDTGLVGKLTGLFGFGKKAPEDSPTTAHPDSTTS